MEEEEEKEEEMGIDGYYCINSTVNLKTSII